MYWGFTFIVKWAIEVVAAGVEAGGELYEVAGPGVASSRETGEGHQLLSTSGEEVSVHAAVIWQNTQDQQAILLVCYMYKITENSVVINMGLICGSASRCRVTLQNIGQVAQHNQASNRYWKLVTSCLLT